MFQKVIDAVKRYSGYARFVRPAWDKYEGFVTAHPRIAAIVIAALALLAIR